MNKIMTIPTTTSEVYSTHSIAFSQKQLDILKNSICKGISNEEFEIFLMACKKTQLDPFMKQIYAVQRKNKRPDGSWGQTMTIQTGIDGYRLIAERTGCYAPGQEPSYSFDSNGNLQSATAYVKKQTKDGTWHVVSSSAYVDEYMQTFTDKQTGEKKPTGMWVNMPKTMLAKCAESQALRKAFPFEMSGVYTKEEMQQAEELKISLEQACELEMIVDDCEDSYKQKVYSYIKKHYNIEKLCDLPIEIYDTLRNAAIKNMQKNHEEQKNTFSVESQLLIQEV